MLKRIPILILLASSILNSFAQLPREVWFDPTGTALASGGATGSLSNPLGGSGTSFDANMVFLTAGASGTPTYPNLVIHLKAGTYTTYGHKHPGYGSGGEISWWLRKGQRLIGEGIDRTIVKRINPNNDLYYVLASAYGESNVEVQDLTIDGNYSASTNPYISVGALNMWHLGRVRGVKITGAAGNSSQSLEMFALRMSGTALSGSPEDRSATGGLIENCEVSVTKGGWISAVMVGAGQSMVVNNRITLPHYTTPSGSDNTGLSAAINIADSVNSIVTGNSASGGYIGLYSDTGTVTNVTVIANQFHDSVRGVELLRDYAAPVSDVIIAENIIHLSSDTNVADNRYGILMHTTTSDSSSHISRVKITDNLVKGGKTGPTPWGLYLSRVNYPICHENRLDNVGNGGSPTTAQQTYFDTSGGLIYGLFNHQGIPLDSEKWLSPRSSDWLNRKTIASTDTSTSYAVLVGDKYIGLQKAGYTVSLPSASSYTGKEIVIVNETGTTLTGSILNCAVAGQTINGATSVSLAAPYTSVRVTSNGSTWIRF